MNNINVFKIYFLIFFYKETFIMFIINLKIFEKYSIFKKKKIKKILKNKFKRFYIYQIDKNFNIIKIIFNKLNKLFRSRIFNLVFQKEKYLKIFLFYII